MEQDARENQGQATQEAKRSFIRRIPGYRSGKPWKMFIATVVYLAIIIGIVAAFSGNEKGQTPGTQPPAQSSQQASQPTSQPASQPPAKKDVRLISGPEFTRGQFGERYVTGRVKNETDRSYKYVQVEINLYDSGGVQVGSTMTNVNNLEPGAVWEFKAPVIEEKAVKCEVKGITKI